MNQYFVDSKSKLPQFFSFNKFFQIQETGFDFSYFIKEFQDKFETEQQENWTKFWSVQGEDLVLDRWKEKYKDYLIEQKYSEDLEESVNLNDSENNTEKPFNKSAGNDVTSCEQSWNTLWQEHRNEIYCEYYLIFTTIYYNYFFDLKKSCELSETVTEVIDDIEDKKDAESLKLALELEQLKFFGLPTSFSSRPQDSSKANSKKKIVHYSDFFSDSEMENESDNGSDIEESDQTNVEDTLHNVHYKSINKQQRRKRNRKLKNVPSFILEEKGLLKYWRKRFSLFSRFDEGIRLDRESWFSVTPEKVAKHLAARLKCHMIIDGFCGSGGNSIQFALTCDKVIAIDIDPVKLEMAKHNANIYKVAHKIDFILGDFLQLVAGGGFKADIVFLSPPWGGPKYKNKKEFDIEKYLLPVKASDLLATARNVSNNIAFFLPRNSNVKQIVKLAGIGNRCEIEHNYLDSRLVAITALYGEDILTKQNSL